jgi:hypothetical protein
VNDTKTIRRVVIATLSVFLFVAGRAMEQLSTWLEQATEEGRADLNSLRASTTEKNDLTEALQRAIDECRTARGAEIALSVSGAAREILPVVRDEVYWIALRGDSQRLCAFRRSARAGLARLWTRSHIANRR